MALAEAAFLEAIFKMDEDQLEMLKGFKAKYAWESARDTTAISMIYSPLGMVESQSKTSSDDKAAKWVYASSSGSFMDWLIHQQNSYIVIFMNEQSGFREPQFNSAIAFDSKRELDRFAELNKRWPMVSNSTAYKFSLNADKISEHYEK